MTKKENTILNKYRPQTTSFRLIESDTYKQSSPSFPAENVDELNKTMIGKTTIMPKEPEIINERIIKMKEIIIRLSSMLAFIVMKSSFINFIMSAIFTPH